MSPIKKVTYTFRPDRKIRRGGVNNCINAAIKGALKSSNGDILVETQQAIVRKCGFLGWKVYFVTVSGYPAKYKNFQATNLKTTLDILKTGQYKTLEVKKKGSIWNIFRGKE